MHQFSRSVPLVQELLDLAPSNVAGFCNSVVLKLNSEGSVSNSNAAYGEITRLAARIEDRESLMQEPLTQNNRWAIAANSEELGARIPVIPHRYWTGEYHHTIVGEAGRSRIANVARVNITPNHPPTSLERCPRMSIWIPTRRRHQHVIMTHSHSLAAPVQPKKCQNHGSSM